MTWQATAPLVLVKNQSGHVDYHYEGSLIHWLSEEQREYLLSEGLVAEVGNSELPPEAVAPKKTASQEEWAAWAISKGANSEEAHAASRQELIELYGG